MSHRVVTKMSDSIRVIPVGTEVAVYLQGGHIMQGSMIQQPYSTTTVFVLSTDDKKKFAMIRYDDIVAIEYV